jgi:arylsulfatase A-like enzyme
MCRTKDYKYVHRLYEADELYDLRSDPQELYNRVDDPTLQDVRRQLKDRLLEFYLSTADAVPVRPDRRS